MADRTSLGADPTGLALRTHVNARVKSLFDASRLPLTDVGGTGDAVTATLDPDFDGDGLVDGMTFGITWGAANTGGVTLAINGGSAVPVLDAEGLALGAGVLADGLRSTLEYVGGDFRILSTMGGDAALGRYVWTLTASGTWTAPDLPDDTPVFVEAWGGGGGGGGRGGGGGGGYASRMLRLGDIAPSVTYTIGAGGAGGGTVGSAGANTSFGSFLTAFGGGGGSTTDGGGGGGTHEAGVLGTGGYLGGGDSDVDATSTHGGGGGSTGSNAGRRAVYGGGGGGGGVGAGGAGGSSKYGGNGGAKGVAGSAPGGGGGATAPGARGEIRIWI